MTSDLCEVGPQFETDPLGIGALSTDISGNVCTHGFVSGQDSYSTFLGNLGKYDDRAPLLSACKVNPSMVGIKM